MAIRLTVRPVSPLPPPSAPSTACAWCARPAIRRDPINYGGVVIWVNICRVHG